jgi:hypothetical protein
MRWKAALCVGLIAPLTGCNLVYYASHNLTNEVVSRLDERKLDRRLRSDARAAWREVGQQYQVGTRCPEFEDGFRDGYIDYLQHGGVPRPPVVPPLKYRRSKYLSPEGQARVKEYFQGFQYGAEVAAASGKREYLTVPVLLPPPPPVIPLNVTRVPVLPAPPGAMPLAPAAPLPEPRPVASRPKPDPRPLTEPITAPPARSVSVPVPMEVPKPALKVESPEVPRAAPNVEPTAPAPVPAPPPAESAPVEAMPEAVPPVPVAPQSVPPAPDPMPLEK